MNLHFHPITLFAVCTLALAHGNLVASDESEVRSIFECWIKLSNSYDPNIAEIYGDKCEPVFVKQQKDGTKKVRKWTATEWKAILSKATAYGKTTGAKDTFAEITTEVIKHGRVRLTANWTSQPSNTSSSGTWLFEKFSGETWRIVEERTEVKE